MDKSLTFERSIVDGDVGLGMREGVLCDLTMWRESRFVKKGGGNLSASCGNLNAFDLDISCSETANRLEMGFGFRSGISRGLGCIKVSDC